MLEILGKIGFDWQVALANLINFLIIFFVLKKFFWKSIKGAIQDRKKVIEQGLDDAEKARTELMMVDISKEEKIKEAKKEGNAIISSANNEAGIIVEESRQGAKKEYETIIKEANSEAGNIRLKMEDDFKKEALSLVLAVSEKILKEKIDEKENEKIINNLLATSK